MTTLSTLGERELIARIRARLPQAPDVCCGAGDDCAVVRVAPDDPLDLLLTSDAVIEGRHFTADTPREAVGHKAIGRALSDLAAMGGEPRWALVDLVAPDTLDAADIDALYGGALDVAREHGLLVVGGDTAQGDRLELHVFAVGSVPRDRALLRSGATRGDVLAVTGRLGGRRCPEALAPRLREGQWLRDWATSMIDISDGIATDARHLAQQGTVGIRLCAAQIPIADAALQADDGRSPLEHALADGEDHELLFTVSHDRFEAFLDAWGATFQLPCTRIGSVTDRRGVLEIEDEEGDVTPLELDGYEHFHDSH